MATFLGPNKMGVKRFQRCGQMIGKRLSVEQRKEQVSGEHQERDEAQFVDGGESAHARTIRSGPLPVKNRFTLMICQSAITGALADRDIS
jgi:hypothetical protein